jgi:dTDP-4-dehydrorhamnose 3,5-epimerase
MQIETTHIPELQILTPRVFRDSRGLFLETWQEKRFAESGLDVTFVQDNFSSSHRHVLRGLHYQIDHPQGKLVHVSRGRVFDVVVDLRRSSVAFGQHFTIELDSTDHRMLFVPPGCAHGFLVLSDDADFGYRCTDYYTPSAERTLLWNDPQLDIRWPIDIEPILSDKDRQGRPLTQAECFP